MIRRVAAIILASLLVSACGGGSTAVQCTKDYWDSVVGTCLPDHWAVIDAETLRQRGVPEEVIVAFQSDVAVSGQFPVVSVVREPLQGAVTASDYSSANIRLAAAFPGYELVDTSSVTIDSEAVQMHTFVAQPREGEPKRRYYQISTVHGSNGFTVSATTPVSVASSVENQVLAILEHFTLEEPQKQAE